MISSTASGMAIRAALFLALQPPGACVTVRDIAAGTGLPEPYLAKIMRQLAAAGLVHTFRGPGGGVALAPDPKALTLWTVACAVDPALERDWCIMGLQLCSHDRACPLHDRCTPLRAASRRLLKEATLASLTGSLRRSRRSGVVPWLRVPDRARRPSRTVTRSQSGRRIASGGADEREGR